MLLSFCIEAICSRILGRFWISASLEGRASSNATVFRAPLRWDSSVMATSILRMCLHSCRVRKCVWLNTRRQSRPAQGIRNRSLFGRRVGRVLESSEICTDSSPANGSHSSNSSGNGQPRLRDQLCLLIRQHNLDPNLVKAYAADFCGTEALSGASRELVESFISHLASAAKENRDALVCKLNSYAQPVEAQP